MKVNLLCFLQDFFFLQGWVDLTNLNRIYLTACCMMFQNSQPLQSEAYKEIKNAKDQGKTTGNM